MNQNIYYNISAMIGFMTSLLAAKFVLNDIPHMVGLTNNWSNFTEEPSKEAWFKLIQRGIIV